MMNSICDIPTLYFYMAGIRLTYAGDTKPAEVFGRGEIKTVCQYFSKNRRHIV